MASAAIFSPSVCHVAFRQPSGLRPSNHAVSVSSSNGYRVTSAMAVTSSTRECVNHGFRGTFLAGERSRDELWLRRRRGVGGGEVKVTAKLQEGEILPELGFLETDQSTSLSLKTVSLNEEVKSSGIVLFVYPKADTSGCTKQACGFNDARATFAASGYTIFGISADIPSAQLAWKQKQSYEFTLLSDPLHKALKALGVSDGSKITRSHFLIEKGGKCVKAEIGISSGDSVPEALKAIGKGLEPKISLMDA